MHEFSICKALLDLALRELANAALGASRIVRMRMVVGQLRQVLPEQMQTAYSFLTRDTLAANSVLEIQTVPIEGRCQSCGWTGPLDHADFRCSSCRSEHVTMTKGRELYLASIEIDEGVKESDPA